MKGGSITRDRLRTWWPWLAMVAAALAVAIAAGAPPGDGPALDPSSTGPNGTKAVVDTLRLLGADVSVQSEAPDASATAALLLDDGLDDPTRQRVADWVDAGGTLVVTDVSSPLSPVRPGRRAELAFLEPELRRDCAVPALSQVQRLDVPGAVLQQVPEGATGCFRAGTDDAWLVIVREGQGTVVALGGAGFIVNGNLDQADNGLLAVSLLAPTRSERVVVLRPRAPGGGERSLIDLVTARWKLAVLQLAVAFGVLVVWRSRRLGRPVLEPQPVQLAGSELVVAVGELLQRAKGRDQAASLLRDDLRRWLAERIGLPPATPAEVVAEAVGASRSAGDLTADEVRRVLAGGRPADEDGLVALAHAVESIRRRVRGAI
ncbi:MAG: hypothetical protein QOG43_518 [Actinomycetota bacterium]|jgi:hypothetical protein|nr:hypothetical protein [Actinomycetota bacterium]